MTKKELIELVAEAIYHTRYKEIDEIVNQSFHKFWKTNTPWDQDDTSLCEWERDDYRWEAQSALKVLLEHYHEVEKLIIKNIIE